MHTQAKITPGRKVINGINAPLLENTINQNRTKQQSKQCLIRGSINICILSVILYDLTYTCPLYISYVQYIEYILAIILSLNILYHFGRYLRMNLGNKTVPCMPAVNIGSPGTPVNKITSTPELTSPNISLSNTPMNTTALSWMSNSTPSESFNYPVKSDSWLYSHGTPKAQNASPVKSPRLDTSGIDFISDEDSLKTYLKDFETNEKISNLSNPVETPTNAMTSFWSYPLNKSQKDTSSFLKRCQYQLSSSNTIPGVSLLHMQPKSCTAPSIPNYYYGLFPPFSNNLEKVISIIQNVSNMLVLLPASTSNSPKDDKSSPRGSPSQGMETWRRLSIDVVTLTQWNVNLRMWLSQTILLRLIKEFDNIDDALQKQGLSDIQVGKVGLDRLRKTAQTMQVLQFIPTLPTVIPFLEVTPNQEYLIQRIKELAKGGCMSEFKWNSGGTFNGKEWDTSLPTDSAIIMHLFACYLDTQLLPLPNDPDVRPFSGYYYVKLNEKLPTLAENSVLIQQCSDYPPHYKVVVGEEVYEVVKGYNNLFHTVLLFLYFINSKQHGMIGRVNVGRSGLNMLWIIQS